MSVSRDVALGYRKRKDNPFFWYEVVLKFQETQYTNLIVPGCIKVVREGGGGLQRTFFCKLVMEDPQDTLRLIVGRLLGDGCHYALIWEFRTPHKK